MQELLEFIIKNIVDNPASIKIEEKALAENSFLYTIYADKNDMGKVIGKEGKIIQAIRNVVKLLAVKENKQIRIEIGEVN